MTVSSRNMRLIIISALFVFSFYLQQILYFSNDVSWLLEASRRLLHGGNYTNDFFENNPPLILYLYLPAVLLKEITHIHIMLSLQLYIYFLITVSLYICHILCKKIFFHEESYLAYPVVLSLAAILLIIVNRDFGQREHLLLILTAPYMLLLVARIKNVLITPSLAIVIGIMAGLGFFLKPYFLVTFCLLELYYMIKTKNWQSWSRLETRSMLVVLLIYLSIVLFRHADYLTFVMPYSVRWCAATDHLPLAVMVDNGFDGFFLCAGLLYLYQRREMDCKEYSDILLLATTAYLAIFILEATYWTYHLYPALACLLLMLTYLFVQRVARLYNRYDFIAIGLFTTAIIFLLNYYSVPIWTASIIFSNSYILYFSFIFSLYMALYFYLNRTSREKKNIIFLATVLVTIVSAVALEIANKSDWSMHQFLIVNVITLALISLLIIKICGPKREHVISFIAIIVTFALPFYMIRSYIDRSIGLKYGVGDLAAFMQQEAAHKSVYIFTMELSYAFPIITYGNDVTSASRSSQFIGLGGMIKQNQLKSGDSLFLSNMVAEDIDTRKPDFVLVDHREEMIGQPYANNGRLEMKAIPFNYLDYFNKNQAFCKAWQHYALIKKINRYDIYQRIS